MTVQPMPIQKCYIGGMLNCFHLWVSRRWLARRSYPIGLLLASASLFTATIALTGAIIRSITTAVTFA